MQNYWERRGLSEVHLSIFWIGRKKTHFFSSVFDRRNKVFSGLKRYPGTERQENRVVGFFLFLKVLEKE